VNKPATESITFSKTLIAQSVSAALLATAAGGAAAQEIEEVIVTATKRSENIQDVPLAITAMAGEFVKDVNLDDVKDLVTFTNEGRATVNFQEIAKNTGYENKWLLVKTYMDAVADHCATNKHQAGCRKIE